MRCGYISYFRADASAPKLVGTQSLQAGMRNDRVWTRSPLPPPHTSQHNFVRPHRTFGIRIIRRTRTVQTDRPGGPPEAAHAVLIGLTHIFGEFMLRLTGGAVNAAPHTVGCVSPEPNTQMTVISFCKHTNDIRTRSIYLRTCARGQGRRRRWSAQSLSLIRRSRKASLPPGCVRTSI